VHKAEAWSGIGEIMRPGHFSDRENVDGARDSKRHMRQLGAAIFLVGLGALIIPATGCERATPTASPKSVVIAVSGDTAGWLTPCGCASNQAGGLPRRGTYLAGLRGGGGGADVLYLDAGGAAGGVSGYHRDKFEAILSGERAMGVAAHNLGKSELALGADALRDLVTRTGTPLVSANARGADGKPIAPAAREVEAGGRTFLVVGVVSPRYAANGITVSDPRAGVLDALAKFPASAKGRVVVVLAYLPEDELAALAAGLPEVDAVVGGPTGQAVAPRRVGPVLLAAATNKGKFLVRLDAPAGGAAWTGEVVEMGPKLADAADQTGNVRAFLDRLVQRDYSAKDTGVVEPPPPGTPAGFKVAGSAACAACHPADTAVWKQSKHAHAFDTIHGKGYQADASCQSCHTTGFAMPGGFDRMSIGTAKVHVGCESCHGPSAAHAASPAAARTPWRAADQCARCHDHENSPAFNYDTYWPKIAHDKGTGSGGR